MKITDDDIQNLAHLSRLELSNSEAISMKEDLSKILDFIATIEQLDLKNIEPLVYMTTSENVLREDRASSSIGHDQAMKNAPEADSDYFKSDTITINKIIDKADYILVHHSHFDHLADVPYIAKKTGAKVIATETSCKILSAYGIPDEHIRFDDFGG